MSGRLPVVDKLMVGQREQSYSCSENCDFGQNVAMLCSVDCCTQYIRMGYLPLKKPGSRQGRVKESAKPKFMLSFASRSLPSYIALTISMISRGGVKINVSRNMIKLDFWPWPRVEKMVPARLEITARNSKITAFHSGGFKKGRRCPPPISSFFSKSRLFVKKNIVVCICDKWGRDW